jgi:hypothetical protein
VWEHESRILGFVCAHNLGFRDYLSEQIVDPSASHRGSGVDWFGRLKKRSVRKASGFLLQTYGAMRSRFTDHMGGNRLASCFRRRLETH